MKKFLYILLALMLIPAGSLACDFEKDFLGKDYDVLNPKLKINFDLYRGDLFSQTVRAQNFNCKDLKASESELSFVKNNLARIRFINISEQTDLLNYANLNFQNSAHPKNQGDNSPKNYADYWDKDKIIVTYRNEIINDKQNKETLSIELKKYSEELYKMENTIE